MANESATLEGQYLNRVVSFRKMIGSALVTLTGCITRIAETKPLIFEVRCPYGNAYINEEICHSYATFEPGPFRPKADNVGEN